MNWLLVAGIFLGLMALYVVFVRPVIRDEPWAKPFFDKVEPIEIRLFKKSETILWARTLQAVGFLLTVLTYIGQIDLTPLLAMLPEEHRAIAGTLLPLTPMMLSFLGRVDESLRKDVSKPLAVVELPNDMPPKVKAAVQEFEVAKADVKAAVAVATASDEREAAGGKV